jgi:hypothetical protein
MQAARRPLPPNRRGTLFSEVELRLKPFTNKALHRAVHNSNHLCRCIAETDPRQRFARERAIRIRFFRLSKPKRGTHDVQNQNKPSDKPPGPFHRRGRSIVRSRKLRTDRCRQCRRSYQQGGLARRRPSRQRRKLVVRSRPSCVRKCRVRSQSRRGQRRLASLERFRLPHDVASPTPRAGLV